MKRSVLQASLIVLFFWAQLSVAFAGRTNIYTEKDGTRDDFSMRVSASDNRTLVVSPEWYAVKKFKKIKAVDIGSGWKVDIRKHTIKRWEKSTAIRLDAKDFDLILKGRKDCTTFKPTYTTSFDGKSFHISFEDINPITDYIKIRLKNTEKWSVMAEDCLNCDQGCD